jgi:hypothetical protein
VATVNISMQSKTTVKPMAPASIATSGHAACAPFGSHLSATGRPTTEVVRVRFANQLPMTGQVSMAAVRGYDAGRTWGTHAWRPPTS